MMQLPKTTGHLIRSIVARACNCLQYNMLAEGALQEGHAEIASVFSDEAEMEKRRACFLLDQLSRFLESESQDSETWASCFRTLSDLAEESGFAQVGAMYKLLLV